MKSTFVSQVAAFFRAHPNTWIGATSFEHIGGRQAWRTRISDCRTDLGMEIRNRTRRVRDHDGRTYTVSEYMYIPSSANQPTTRPANDLNQPFELVSSRVVD